MDEEMPAKGNAGQTERFSADNGEAWQHGALPLSMMINFSLL